MAWGRSQVAPGLTAAPGPHQPAWVVTAGRAVKPLLAQRRVTFVAGSSRRGEALVGRARWRLRRHQRVKTRADPAFRVRLAGHCSCAPVPPGPAVQTIRLSRVLSRSDEKPHGWAECPPPLDPRRGVRVA